MIAAFNVIAQASAMGRPELLAAGISEALITTAAGLVVAIPSLSAYLYFVGRVDQLLIEIDAHSQKVVERVSAEALQDSASRGKRAKAA
jgi:biopolymer transport protein ExbB